MPQVRPPHRDDNLMERFDREGARRFRGRDAVVAIAIAALVLVVCAGGSVRKAGREMSPGIGRDLVMAVGAPAGWVADQLPFHNAAHTLTAWLSPDQALSSADSFVSTQSRRPSSSVPPVTSDAFDPIQLGAPEPPRRRLHRLLVTGDSMSQPLDVDLARTLAARNVSVIRDAHIGTGISKSILLDWGKLSVTQVQQDHPDAVVVFIGANEGFAMPGPGGAPVNCCSAEWAATYAQRARAMMNTYRQAGLARVYWLTLPTPRGHARAQIARVVNAAVEVAAEPWRSQIRIVDTIPTFTPGALYRDSIPINGQPTIVREADGIHLNDAGSSLAAKLVLSAVDRDFTR